MVLNRLKCLALAMTLVGATTAGAQRGFGGGPGAIGGRASDGPRPLLFGFALACVNCRATGRGGRVGGGARGAFGQWHYDEYPRIAAVMDGSAAQLAGIKVGDVLLSVDGRSLLDDEGAEHFSEIRAGDTVHLTLDRNGKAIGVNLVLRRMAGRGIMPATTPALSNSPNFVTSARGVRVEVWSGDRVAESTDSSGATILKIGSTTIRLAGDSPLSAGRGRGGRGGNRGGPP
jgi:membrane-associated protease RseP (regulator of RpoE activity)